MPNERRDPLRELELKRLKEREKADLEVEANRGPRPLEGMSEAPTTWTQEQNDAEASEVHGKDAEESMEASKRQAQE